VKRLLVVTSVLLVGAGVFLVVNVTSPPWYERLRYPLRYEQIVRGHARNYGVDPALLAAVIYRESKFDAHARSESGAVGLMQLRPDTAKGIAIRTGGTAFQVSDLTNPEINVRYGCWYLRNLYRKYREWRLVLAAYNAGQGNVDRWLAAGRSEIPFAETREYVDGVLDLRRIYHEAWRKELGYR
jgi:soluble lytic murein transglycosylase